ncbi:MAG: NB-ARC domain-containing protein [Candidatus Eremiobacteraeota bacterium]|nr:NB-ARC domain-containing protein [Candidatus Eremiobacteraeota bacterium]
MTTPAPIRARMLGDFALIDGQHPQARPPTRHARALFSFLALNAGTPVRREGLVDQFWPDADPTRGRANLSTALWHIRRMLDPAASALEAGRDIVRLALDIQTDVGQFEAACARGDADTASQVYLGDFLPGCEDAWTGAERERLAIAYEAVLRRALAQTAQPEHAWKLLERDPYSEDAFELLVRDALLHNNRRIARALLDRWSAALHELGVEGDSRYAAAEKKFESVERAGVIVQPRSQPVDLTSFIGRGSERRALQSLLASARIVTLVGPGGIGKTRLAKDAFAQHREHFDFDAFIDVTQLTGAAAVEDAVCAALGTQAADLIAFSAAHSLFILLDNAEDALQACAAVTLRIAAHASSRILLTSREALNVPGEVVLRVESLAEADSFELFVARAHESGRALDTKNAAVRSQISAICADLDHLPLAIELVASRAATIALTDLREGLLERLDAFVGGHAARNAHLTLRSLFDMSYERLSASEAILLDRLAVFVAPVPFDAIAAVVSDEHLPERIVFPTLCALVERSLVVAEEIAGEGCYRLLSSTRAYAAERLDQRGDTARLRLSLRRWTTAKLAHSDLVRTRDGEAAYEPLSRMLHTLRALVLDVLNEALRDGAADQAASIVLNFRRIWIRFGPIDEGIRWTLLALEEQPSDATPTLLLFYDALASLYCEQLLPREAIPYAEQLLESATKPSEALRAHMLLANSYDSIGQWDRARSNAESGLRLAREQADEGAQFFLLCNEGWAALRIAGRAEEARANFLQAYDAARRMRWRTAVATCRRFIAEADIALGQLAAARSQLMSVIEEFRSIREATQLSQALLALCTCLRAQGSLLEWRSCIRETITLADTLSMQELSANIYEELFFGLILWGEQREAAVALAGAINADRQTFDFVRSPVATRRFEEALAALQVHLSDDFMPAYERGRVAGLGFLHEEAHRLLDCLFAVEESCA